MEYIGSSVTGKAHQQFPGNKNRIWVIKPNLFSFVLSLVSLAHRVPRAEALHLALQTRISSVKWLHPTLPRTDHVQKRCA